MSNRKAFTLIELLVVIAIIALLLSILMPALSKVKEQAKNLVCATNLRTLFTSWSLYATDSNNKICQPYTYNGNTAADDPRSDKSSWAWAPWNEASDSIVPANANIEQREEGIRRGSLFTYADNVKVYVCKSKASNFSHYRSYSIPDFLNGEWGAPGLTGSTNDTYITYRKVGAITQPSMKFVFIEENDWRLDEYLHDSFVLQGGTVRSQSTTIWGDPITVRHAGKSSFVFADGHTEFKSWSKDTVDIMETPIWNATPTTTEGEDDIQWILDHWTK